MSVLVATHKPYWMPADELYMPIRVGACDAAPIDGLAHDDTGDNISEENGRYSELTGLYWGWKNLSGDHLGLVHYRRHFKGSGERGTLTGEEARCLLSRVPLILPKRRNYYIETVESHYAHTFDELHIACLRLALEASCPEYLPAFNAVMAQRGFHAFNMFIMRRDLAERYCAWLFEVLHLAESGIDFTGMTPFHERCMGRMGEFLIDTWALTNEVAYAEVPVANMEPVNWVKKGGGFLAAKYFGKRYEKSF